MDVLFTILVIIVVLILGVVIWYISAMNALRSTEVKIEESLSGIDVALTKRYDVLKKSLEVAKGYAAHEVETFSKIVALRKGMSLQEKENANRTMDEVSKGIQVIAESYPELKSQETFVQLQKTVNDVEEHLQASRRAYNSNVSHYNILIVSFPSSIVATKIQANKREFFQAEEFKRNDIEIDFK